MIKVLIKGAGDLASGVAMAFHKSGFQVLMTEVEQPTVIRSTVAFATSVFKGEIKIEGVKGKHVTADNFKECLDAGNIGIIIDPQGAIKDKYKPDVLVDAILAKKNIGTTINDAPIVIGCGPGFSAGEDCHLVIETKRGHYLGRVIEKGAAIENSGIPGIVEGRGLERVLYSPVEGMVKHYKKIGDIVDEGDIILKVEEIPVTSPFKGVIRGMITEGMIVPKAMKIGDVDPRIEPQFCFTISEKAMAIGRASVEGSLLMGRRKGLFGVGKYE
ncbi:MAG: selenium-dependent molybdenum cofactor biosynthesis protein YqeB [Firmicutes bacterium]|nr:selenium-dependent molybdenum cofactor biosynthesis protein YqeB [Bacillota bacterium]